MSTERISLTLPVNLIAEVKEILERENLSRSKIIRDLLIDFVREKKRAQLREDLKAAALEMAEDSLRLAEEWASLEEEAWELAEHEDEDTVKEANK